MRAEAHSTAVPDHLAALVPACPDDAYPQQMPGKSVTSCMHLFGFMLHDDVCSQHMPSTSLTSCMHLTGFMLHGI